MWTSPNRRQFFFVVGTAALAVACGTESDPTGPAQLVELDPFEALEQKYSSRLGVFAVDLANGTRTAYRVNERFAFCSTFKVYAAGAVLAAVDSGQLTLADVRTVTAEDKVPESAVDWAPGETPTLAELCAAALTRSDNTSGNLLIREIGGTQALTDFARSLGDDSFRLDRTEPELNTAIPGDERDTTTPTGLGEGYLTLLTGDRLSPGSRDQLVQWMGDTRTSDTRFRAGIPSGWTSADKTGTGSYGVSNDAGLLLGPDGRRVLLIVLCTTTTDNPDAPATNQLAADVAREVLARG
jgi:beta-lactamase class A